MTKKINLKLLIIILAIRVKQFLVLGAAEDEEKVRIIRTEGWEEGLEGIN